MLVADLFQPINDLAVEIFLNGDVRYSSGVLSAVPMFFARREPDDIAGMNFFNRAALALRVSAAGVDNQILPERIFVWSAAVSQTIRSAATDASHTVALR